MRGMIKYILEQEEDKGGILDKEFIEKHTSEFPEFEAKVKSEDWNFLVKQSGLTKEQIVEAAEIYINSQATIICWAMGLTRINTVLLIFRKSSAYYFSKEISVNLVQVPVRFVVTVMFRVTELLV